MVLIPIPQQGWVIWVFAKHFTLMTTRLAPIACARESWVSSCFRANVRVLYILEMCSWHWKILSHNWNAVCCYACLQLWLSHTILYHLEGHIENITVIVSKSCQCCDELGFDKIMACVFKNPLFIDCTLKDDWDVQLDVYFCGNTWSDRPCLFKKKVSLGKQGVTDRVITAWWWWWYCWWCCCDSYEKAFDSSITKTAQAREGPRDKARWRYRKGVNAASQRITARLS